MNLRYARRSEDTEQVNVILWATRNVSRYPELEDLYHIPNGGSRNKAEAVKLKQMGVKAGVSDLHLPYPKGKYSGLFIEMKYDRNVATVQQTAFLQRMNKAGHFTAICYGAYAAIEVIEKYLQLEYGDGMDMTVMACDVHRNDSGILVFK